MNGSFVEAYFNRGSLKNELGDYAGAIADLDAAISLLPDYAAALYVRGIAKSNLNDPEACQDIEAALSMGHQPAAGQPTPSCP
jgi:tetratricopeptide (TPR) repeat protein